MAVAYNPSTIDWSQLAGIGQNVGSGLKTRRLNNVFADGLPMDENGAIDYAAASDALARAGFTKEALLLSDQANSDQFKYGLNLQFDENGRAYQAYAGGGVRPVELPDGAKFAAPAQWVQTPDGWRQVPTKAPMGGGGMPPASPPAVGPPPQSGGYAPPTQVQTQSVSPDGTMTPTQAIPSLESAKFNKESTEDKATARSIAKDAISGFTNMRKVLGRFINKEGQPEQSLEAITGSNAIGLPKAWLPNVSETARNATSDLESGAIQVGLNTLAKMRAASAQGASGMGQLAIQESIWLQNSIESLQEAQGTPQAAQRIQEVIYYSNLVEQRVREKFREVYGEELGDEGMDTRATSAPASAPASPRKVFDINGVQVQ